MFKHYIAVAIAIIFGLGSMATIAAQNLEIRNTLYGGEGGRLFSEFPVRGSRLSEIRIGSGNLIDSIQLVYQRGNKKVIGVKHGGDSKQKSTFKLRKNEYIVELGGRYGKYIDSVYLRTNQGRSKSWGGKGGEQSFRIRSTKNNPIVGVWGRSGKRIDSIGSIHGSINKGSKLQIGYLKELNRKNKEKQNQTNSDNCENCDYVVQDIFPDIKISNTKLQYLLNDHSDHLLNIIQSVEKSKNQIQIFLTNEKKDCRYNLLCEVVNRRSAISHLLGAN